MLSVTVILSPSCSSGPDHNDHNTGSYHELELQLPGEHRVVRDRDIGEPGATIWAERRLEKRTGIIRQTRLHLFVDL